MRVNAPIRKKAVIITDTAFPRGVPDDVARIFGSTFKKIVTQSRQRGVDPVGEYGRARRKVSEYM